QCACCERARAGLAQKPHRNARPPVTQGWNPAGTNWVRRCRAGLLLPTPGSGTRVGGRMAECSENRRKGEEGLSLRQRDHSATWQKGVAESPLPASPRLMRDFKERKPEKAIAAKATAALLTVAALVVGTGWAAQHPAAQ